MCVYVCRRDEDRSALAGMTSERGKEKRDKYKKQSANTGLRKTTMTNRQQEEKDLGA